MVISLAAGKHAPAHPRSHATVTPPQTQIGTYTTLPALQAFSCYAAVSILAVYCYQCTFFVACLALDARRERRKRAGAPGFACAGTCAGDGAADEVMAAAEEGSGPRTSVGDKPHLDPASAPIPVRAGGLRWRRKPPRRGFACKNTKPPRHPRHIQPTTPGCADGRRELVRPDARRLR